MKDHVFGYPIDAIREIIAQEERRARVAQETTANMGRRQAAFARAAEVLARRPFNDGMERLAAEIALAGFFAGA